MCNFLSFVVVTAKQVTLSSGDIAHEGDILCASLLHHEKTVEYLGLKPETYREAEWLEDDDGKTLTVRTAPGERESVFLSAVLAKYPNRKSCFAECLRQFKESTGKLDCSNCSALTAIDAPKATTLDCSNCSALTAIDAPKATALYCYNCSALTAIDAPKATTLYCYNCSALKRK